MQINLAVAKFVVIGAGETGRSICDYLTFHQAQILRILDTRQQPPTIPGHQVLGGALAWEKVADADVIVISPGVSIFEPVLQQALHAGIQVVGDVELFAQAIASWPSQVIGITGSNGKTTVTSLTGFLASAVGIKTLVAGNIGTPVLSAWLEINATQAYPDLIVLELSSFQLESTFSLNYISSCVLNISEDHLDRYRDLLEYAYVKSRIFNNSRYQILNRDDRLVSAMQRTGCRSAYFALANADYCLSKVADEECLTINGQQLVAVSQLQLVGRHNYLNALASLALLAAAGYELIQFVSPLCQFKGLEHRMQKVIEHDGVIYLEDSKGTNVGAVLAGVSGIERPVHLILGGDGKGQDFSPLRELVVTKCKSVAIIGQDADKIAAVLAGIENVICYSSLEAAVIACMKQAKSGDAVILSPACASWDMFANYKQRAQVFVDTIYAHLK